MNEKQQSQIGGLKFLYEMEWVRDPQLINNLELNLFSLDSGIKEVEFIFDEHNKKLLIYLELSWWATKFRSKLILEDVQSLINQLLPSYQHRVVFEAQLFNSVVERIQRK